ncbi:hypothetical protein B9057_06040 [Aestuarium zhoushanense]|nr:hypothetical protein B9057_06040 [Aestuarium zhoushanense]
MKAVDLKGRIRDRLIADMIAFTSDGLKPLNTLCRAAAMSLGYDVSTVTVRLGHTVFCVGRYGSDVKQFEVLENPTILAPSESLDEVVESFNPDVDFPGQTPDGRLLAGRKYWLAAPISIEGMLIARFNFNHHSTIDEPASERVKGIAKDYASVAGTIMNSHRLLKMHVRQTFEALEALDH